MIQLILTDPTGSPLGHMVSTHVEGIRDFVCERLPEYAPADLMAVWTDYGDGYAGTGHVIDRRTGVIVALFTVREILDTQPLGTARGARETL